MAETETDTTNLELFTEDIEAAAEGYDVETARLVEVLEQLDEYLTHGATGFHRAYEEMHTEFDDPVTVVEAGHFEVLYIYPEEWDTFQDDLELTDDEREAARKAHNDTARRMGADEDHLDEHDAVLMITPLVSRLMSAGVSRRQAEVQALRMDGATHETIADELGMALGTVKSHCQRIDEKAEKAQKLSELLE